MIIASHHKPGHLLYDKLRHYDPTCSWPADVYVQWGYNGLVLVKDPAHASGSYYAAFFEAFVKQPAIFIRGEGKLIGEAEASAYAQHKRYVGCPADHSDPVNFEKLGYVNGYGFCLKCKIGKIIYHQEQHND